MTRQTPTHLEHTTLNPRARGAHDLVRLVAEGQLDVDPPYQRGSVWTEDQRVALVRSWMIGLPAGVIIISDRDNAHWAAAMGDVYKSGTAIWAAVDGKQRLLTAQLWFTGQFAVPASWFDPAVVEQTELTEDGPYVRYSGLSEPGRLKFDRRAQFQVAEFRTAGRINDEATMYLLVNGGGTPHTAQEMQHAWEIAETKP
ncbi:DUF262 domain-containing protein [Streptomyces sp. NPDC088775]|uniref:DUF262 domain-containing protein n=1 Tax=Streptomyces sp. NPDC088775 TaxID=3365896 RepID=UPI00382D797F